MRQGSFYIARLKCGDCGTHRDIPRHTSRKKSVGHHKNMWCASCKKQTQFIEGI